MESKNNTTEQLMFSLIEVWKAGGQTQRDFCKEREISFQKFQYWFRKYRAVHSPHKTDSKFFKRIKLAPSVPAVSSATAVELLFPDGRKLIFHQSVEASYLRTLLS